MRRFLVSLGAIVLFLVTATPAIAQAKQASNMEVSASVTYIPYVTLRGTTFEVGSVFKNDNSSTYDPRTGNGSSSFSRTTNLLNIEQARKTVLKFDADIQMKDSGIGVTAGGWTYSNKADIAGSVPASDNLSLWGQNLFVGNGAKYTASDSWNLKVFDGGITYRHATAKVTMKLTMGGAYSKVENKNSISEAHSYDSYYDSYMGNSPFVHDDLQFSTVGSSSFKGLGPEVGFNPNIHLGAVNLHSSTKVAYLFGEQTEHSEWNYRDESSFWFGPGNKATGNNSSIGNVPLDNVEKTAVTVIQQELGISVKIWKLEVGGGIYTSLFRGLNGPASYDGMMGVWRKGQPVNPTLVGATITAKLIF